MGYILDTNALIFYLYNPERLSKAAVDIVHNEDNQIYVSIVSLWEIAIKSSIGKLEIKNSMEEIAGICLKYKIELVAINPRHLDQIANLSQIHGDPFDRLIISQAITENLTIVTSDSIIPKYDANTIWDVKIYLRMRDDHKQDLKKTKQRISAFCLSQGFHYSKGKWTQAHLKWLKSLELSGLDRETLNEYLITYEYQTNRIEAFDKRIEELASETEYVERVKKLVCFLGVKTHTALSCLVETGDFQRFAKGNIYSAYLGLVSGGDSSSDNINRLSITKAGNSHVRKLLVEASKGICKGAVGHKSKDLKARQSGNLPEVVAYADKANERLRRKYYKMIRHGKKKNVAVTAVARELACFIWGMMTDHISMA